MTSQLCAIQKTCCTAVLAAQLRENGKEPDQAYVLLTYILGPIMGLNRYWVHAYVENVSRAFTVFFTTPP